jgi:hypothetical protein
LKNGVCTQSPYSGAVGATSSSTPGQKKKCTMPDYNIRHTTITEIRPDGTRKVVVSNFIGQTKELTLVAKEREWRPRWIFLENFREFLASAGRREWRHTWTYDHDHAGLVRKTDPSGKMHRLDYYLVPYYRAFLRQVQVRCPTLAKSPAPALRFSSCH